MEQTGGHGNGRRLILGFDAGCMTCNRLAARISELAGEHLEIRPLDDPEVERWRKQAFGRDAPWAPTLIEVNSASVKAWTGIRMGVALSHRLGLATTWRLVQTLGDVQGTVQPAESPVSSAAFGMSRGRFLKGLGGTAVALGMLTGNFASVAFARPASQNDALEALKPVKTTDLADKELVDAARTAAQRRDVVNLMGRTWSAGVRNGRAATALEEGGQTIRIYDGALSRIADRTPHAADKISIKAARHELKNGATMLAIAYKLPEDSKILVYYELDRPVSDGEDEFQSWATLYRVEGEEAVFEGLSVDGGREVSKGGEIVTTRISCGGCDSSKCASRRRYCASIKWNCLGVNCGVCIPSCFNLFSCLFCALVQCPYAYFVTCCREIGYRCVGCRYCG